MTRIVPADERGIATAVAALRDGELVGLPTETVYGLAADASNDDAVRRIFAVKRRPLSHPLIVHIADVEQLFELATEVNDACRVLVSHAWPGPLTVIVAANQSVSRVVTSGRDTIGVRLPAHDVARGIIRQLGNAVAAPSANRFGHVSPTTPQHVVDDLGDDVAVVVDGGPCAVGVESTIVDCSRSTPEILRPGAITESDINRLLTSMRTRVLDGTLGEARASGMMERHYAPRAKVRLYETRQQVPRDASPIIDCTEDVPEAARTLYARLRACDDEGHPEVHVVLPTPEGLGYALRDRLKKAAAGR
jgi:L-threonylcarbamoyladenylate synthase